MSAVEESKQETDLCHQLWTQQMDWDAEAGKLDFLFEEADTERAGN